MVNILKYGLAATVATLSTSTYLEYKMKKGDEVLQSPVDTVSIIIPSLNEEMFIEQCLKSLRDQSIIQKYPEYFEFIHVDNGSDDNTVNLARPYVDKSLISPRGKLNARNLGTLNSSGNIIVAVDSDIIYPQNWLNTLLKPFNDPDTVAVSGSILDETIQTPKQLYLIYSYFERALVHPHTLLGGNSAYWKHLFYLIGQFDTTVNQIDVKRITQEEEIGFGKKLSKYGKVVYMHSAFGKHLGGERTSCRQGSLPPSMCLKYKIGIERFG